MDGSEERFITLFFPPPAQSGRGYCISGRAGRQKTQITREGNCFGFLAPRARGRAVITASTYSPSRRRRYRSGEQAVRGGLAATMQDAPSGATQLKVNGWSGLTCDGGTRGVPC